MWSVWIVRISGALIMIGLLAGVWANKHMLFPLPGLVVLLMAIAGARLLGRGIKTWWLEAAVMFGSLWLVALAIRYI